jgi:hypothetical protein
MACTPRIPTDFGRSRDGLGDLNVFRRQLGL